MRKLPIVCIMGKTTTLVIRRCVATAARIIHTGVGPTALAGVWARSSLLRWNRFVPLTIVVARCAIPRGRSGKVKV